MAKSKLKRRANKSKKGAQDEVDPSHAKVSKGASKRPRGKEVSKTNDEEMTATVGPGASSTSKETFQVEFEFFDPEEEDFHSVRDLLCSGTFGALDLDFSGIANSIVDQVNIGTMVKSGAEEAQQSQEAPASDEDDVTLCGMLTILNLRQFSEQVWCKNLVALLESKVKSDKQMLQYTRASGKEQVGLIISERFVNLPLEVIPAMHNVILEDISWSCTTEYCPAEERPFYFFTHFICLARCQAISSGKSEGSLQTFQLKDGSQLLFSRAEELALARAASYVTSFPQPLKDDGPGLGLSTKKRKIAQGGGVKGQERLAVLGLSKKAYEGAVKTLRESLEES